MPLGQRSGKGVVMGRCLTGLVGLSALVFPATVLALQNQPPPQGLTVQLPVQGVAIDASGVLSARLFDDVHGEMAQQRLAAARARQAGPLQAVSAARKVSLRRLSEAIAAAPDGKPDDAMRHLAGLKRIEFVLLCPDDRDILLVGPAANWVEDLSGRSRAVDDGRPVLQLDDLITAVRAVGGNAGPSPWVACSIDPTREGMEALQRVLRQIPQFVNAQQQAELARIVPGEIAASLGLANVSVWGVPADSRLGSILVESDYRMKLMAVGLEPAPDEVTTFVEAIEGAVSGLQRWWLTPKYDLVLEAPDGLGLQLAGQGVQLNTEDGVVLPNQQRQGKPGKPLRAARRYAESFTEHYEAVARFSPVFAELQTAIDLLVVAAWLDDRQALEKTGWDGGCLWDPGGVLPEPRTAPRQVPCVANAVWKGTLLAFPAGGGVSISPATALEPEHLRIDQDAVIDGQRKILVAPPQPESWWWD
jgi:Protein of unknown function (DUF1598)